MHDCEDTMSANDRVRSKRRIAIGRDELNADMCKELPIALKLRIRASTRIASGMADQMGRCVPDRFFNEFLP